MRPVVRSPTSAVPSGRSAMASGAVRFVATTEGSSVLLPVGLGGLPSGPLARGGADGCGTLGMALGRCGSPRNEGAGVQVGSPARAPAAQPARTRTAATASARRAGRRMASSLPAEDVNAQIAPGDDVDLPAGRDGAP